MTSEDTSVELTPDRISALTGVPGEQVQRLERLGVLDRGTDGRYGDEPSALFEVRVPAADAANLDPVCGMLVHPGDEAATAVVESTVYQFCSQGCYEKFTASPKDYLRPHD